MFAVSSKNKYWFGNSKIKITKVETYIIIT